MVVMKMVSVVDVMESDRGFCEDVEIVGMSIAEDARGV
jgi:hypothetical protein